MGETYVIPSPGDDAYLSLSTDQAAKLYAKQQGKLYRKQIFKMDSQFVHPNDKSTSIKIDKALAEKLVHNYRTSGQIVQVPLCNDKNEHVEDPDKNLGEVLDLQYDDKGIYAVIDARKNPENFGKTYLGASAFMNLNAANTETGEKIGPTLLHVAVTNRPYLTNLEDYSEVMNLSADNKDEKPVLLTLSEEDSSSKEETKPTEGAEPVEAEQPKEEEKENTSMDMDSVKAFLKENGFTAVADADYADLQAKATEATELSAKLENATSELKLSDENKSTLETVGEALVELSAANDSLAEEVKNLKADRDALKLSAAESEVDGLIRAGRVLPKQKDVMVKLSMSDRETFEALLPEDSIVKLSESGVTLHEEPARDEELINKYKTMAANVGKPQNKR